MDIEGEMEISYIRSGVYPAHFFERESTNEKSPSGLFLQMCCFYKFLHRAEQKRFQHDGDKHRGKG